MEMFAVLAGSSLPLAVMVFVGSYFGIWKRNTTKLLFRQAISLFLLLWVITAGLWLFFYFILIGQDEPIPAAGKLWGPLIIGIIIGRRLVNSRRKANSKDAINATDSIDI